MGGSPPLPYPENSGETPMARSDDPDQDFVTDNFREVHSTPAAPRLSPTKKGEPPLARLDDLGKSSPFQFLTGAHFPLPPPTRLLCYHGGLASGLP